MGGGSRRSGRPGVGWRTRGTTWATSLAVTAAPALNAPVTGTARSPVIREDPDVSLYFLIQSYFFDFGFGSC